MRAWWQDYINIPFAEKGRDKEGCDCWGLVRLVYKNELGIDLPDYLDVYETTEDRDALSKKIREESEKWDAPIHPQEYDVVILNMRGVPMHVGIITKNNHMIHCARGINTVHENFTISKWKHKVIGYRRWKKA